MSLIFYGIYLNFEELFSVVSRFNNNLNDDIKDKLLNEGKLISEKINTGFDNFDIFNTFLNYISNDNLDYFSNVNIPEISKGFLFPLSIYNKNNLNINLYPLPLKLQNSTHFKINNTHLLGVYVKKHDEDINLEEEVETKIQLKLCEILNNKKIIDISDDDLTKIIERIKYIEIPSV